MQQRSHCMRQSGELEAGVHSWNAFICSAFGEVYIAIDKISNETVAIMKIRASGHLSLHLEDGIIQRCHSKYVVSYYDTEKHGHELWVGLS